MAVALRLVCLLLTALLLSSCYSTRLPDSYKGAARPVVYTVHPNDTLYSIGKRFGIDYHVIARRNRLHSPYRIYIGQHLHITRVAPRSQALPIARSTYRAPVKTAKKKQRSTRHSKPSHKTKARGYAKGHLLWPVKGKATSLFGRRGSRMHDGIDITAKEGTPIHVAAAGTVVYADQRLSGYGKMVIVRHSHNLFTAYAHNQRNLVQKGVKVRRGDMIVVGRAWQQSIRDAIGLIFPITSIILAAKAAGEF